MKSRRISRASVPTTSQESRTAAILHQLGVNATPAEIRDFELWRTRRLWEQYKDEKMNLLTIAQNELNSADIRFANGRQGEPYKQSARVAVKGLRGIAVKGLDGTGLEASVSTDGTVTLHGTPVNAGDVELTLFCRIDGIDSMLSRKFRIAFNPDPRTLWKDKPVPADIEFPKPDTDCAYVLVPEFEGRRQKDIVAASKRGRSHAQEGSPRDDDFRVSFNPQNGWYVLAVADGAGSAKYSREGSAIATREAERFCAEGLAKDGEAFERAIAAFAADKSRENARPVTEYIHNILYKAAVQAYHAIRSKVDLCNGTATMRDFSTTLLLTVCRRFSFGWFIASFGVGDGAIAIYDKGSDAVKLLNEPDSGEYAGQTRFLTMESIFKDRTRIRMSIVPDFTALMLMTDGISDPFFETDANLERKEKWDGLWADLSKTVDFSDDNENAADQLLDWLDFWSPGNHDDRTIAILY